MGPDGNPDQTIERGAEVHQAVTHAPCETPIANAQEFRSGKTGYVLGLMRRTFGLIQHSEIPIRRHFVTVLRWHSFLSAAGSHLPRHRCCADSTLVGFKMGHDGYKMSFLGPAADRHASITIPLRQCRSNGCFTYPQIQKRILFESCNFARSRIRRYSENQIFILAIGSGVRRWSSSVMSRPTDSDRRRTAFSANSNSARI